MEEGRFLFSVKRGSFLGGQAPIGWASAQMRGFKKNSWTWGEKGRSPEALILFALILLNLISNVPGTSRQILRKQIENF